MSRGSIQLGLVIAVIIVAVVLVVALIVLLPVFRQGGGEGGNGSGTLFKSEDGGETWRPLEKFPGGEILTLDLDSRDSSTLLVGTSRRGVWQGKTSGEEFKQFPGGVGEGAKVFDLLDSPTKDEFTALVLFSNRGRVIRFKEGQRTELLFTPLERFAYFQGDVGADGTIRVIGSDGGFYESRNQGASWKTLARFREGLLLMAVNPGDEEEIWVVDSRGSLFRTQNGGSSWEDLTAPLRNFQGTSEAKAILFEPRTQILYHASRHGLLESSNRGRDWERVGLTLPPEALGVAAAVVDPANPLKLIVGAENQIYISEDGGASWKGTQLQKSGRVSRILIDRENPKNVYVGL